MLAVAVARYLRSRQLVDFREGDAGGDCFIASMPPQPDRAVMLMPTGGAQQPTRSPVDLPRLQALFRGVKHDPVGPFQWAQAVLDALACLDGVLLDPGGDHEQWVIGCTPIQSSPGPIGVDENQRHQFTTNFEFRVHHPSVHRSLA